MGREADGFDEIDERKIEWCDHCNESYSRSERGRVKGHCKPCSVAYRQAKQYGLTIPRMNAILRAQDDACPICGELSGDVDAEGISYWHVDHDHKCCNRAGSCGRCVRGLLCKSCNMRGVAWYERLLEEYRDWPRMNAYLADPPAQRPEARVRTVGDLSGIRGRDGSFAEWRSDEALQLGS